MSKDKICHTLGTALVDEIANDGCRNAAGGIYATSVQEFAREVQRAFAQATPEGRAALDRGHALVRGALLQSCPSIAAETSEDVLCACKDRKLSACPGEWEPGCDLGSNPAHARRAKS